MFLILFLFKSTIELHDFLLKYFILKRFLYKQYLFEIRNRLFYIYIYILSISYKKD